MQLKIAQYKARLKFLALNSRAIGIVRRWTDKKPAKEREKINAAIRESKNK